MTAIVYVLLYKEEARKIGEKRFDTDVIPVDVIGVYPTYEKAKDTIALCTASKIFETEDRMHFYTEVTKLPGTTDMETRGVFLIRESWMRFEKKELE